MTKEAIAKAPVSRPKRTPIGRRGKLTVSNKDANYEYRFVNNKDGRVEMFQEAGWEACPSTQVGDKRVENASALGSVAEVGVGLGDKAVLMRIPKEWFAEDQAAKQAQVDATEQTIKDKVRNTHGGRFERDTDPL